MRLMALQSWRRLCGKDQAVPSPRRRRFPSIATITEICEPLILLDGNVSAVVADGELVLEGDAANNSIEIIATAAGVTVRGLNGTTINGAAGDFVAFAGTGTIPGDVRIDLGSGDDVVLVAGGLEINGDIRVKAGQGDDRVGLDDVQINGDLIVNGRAGDDGLYLNEVTVSGNTRFEGQHGDSTLSVHDSTLFGHLVVRGRRGDDAAHLDGASIGGNLKLALREGTNGAFLEDTSVAGRMVFRAHAGNDFVMLESVTVGGPARIRLYAGEDALVVTGSTLFEGRFSADGGVGTDAADLPGDAVFQSDHRLRRFEADDVSAGAIVAALDAPTTGIRTRSNALRDFFNSLPPP
jgi:hypothetical protein